MFNCHKVLFKSFLFLNSSLYSEYNSQVYDDYVSLFVFSNGKQKWPCVVPVNIKTLLCLTKDFCD